MLLHISFMNFEIWACLGPSNQVEDSFKVLWPFQNVRTTFSIIHHCFYGSSQSFENVGIRCLILAKYLHNINIYGGYLQRISWTFHFSIFLELYSSSYLLTKCWSCQKKRKI